jgi:hypothetical protein
MAEQNKGGGGRRVNPARSLRAALRGRSAAQRLYSAPAPCTIAAEKRAEDVAREKEETAAERQNPHARSWLPNQPRHGFHGYPVATVAFYGRQPSGLPRSS